MVLIIHLLLHDFELKIFQITVAIALFDDGGDDIIQPFCQAVGDAILEIDANAAIPIKQHPGKLDRWLYLRMDHVLDPEGQAEFSRFSGKMAEDIPELFFQ